MNAKVKTFFEGAGKIIKKIPEFTKEHLPQILTGVGIVSFVSASGLAIYGTTKAYKKVEEENKKRKVEGAEELVPKEIVKLVWTNYIPMVLTLAAGVTCVILANKEMSKRLAALGVAYALSEDKVKEYRNKIAEKFGDKKAKEIEAERMQKIVDANPVDEQKVIHTGKGDTLCFDPMSGRYFRSSADVIRIVAADLTTELPGTEWVCLNDLYYGIGLKETTIGNYVGWNAYDENNKNKKVHVWFTTILSNKLEPCLCLNYDVDLNQLYGKHCLSVRKGSEEL